MQQPRPRPRGHRQPLGKAPPSPDLHSPKSSPHSPPPRLQALGRGEIRAPSESPPSSGLEQRGSPGRAGSGNAGVDTFCPRRVPRCYQCRLVARIPMTRPSMPLFPVALRVCGRVSHWTVPAPSAAAASAPAQSSLLIRPGPRPYRGTEGFAFSRLPSATRAIGQSALGWGEGAEGSQTAGYAPPLLKGEARPSSLCQVSEWDLRRKLVDFLLLSFPLGGGTLSQLSPPGVTTFSPYGGTSAAPRVP